ncbi:hypothetical protein JKP88DRAFT_255790, partial [Tribonema minus]
MSAKGDAGDAPRASGRRRDSGGGGGGGTVKRPSGSGAAATAPDRAGKASVGGGKPGAGRKGGGAAAPPTTSRYEWIGAQVPGPVTSARRMYYDAMRLPGRAGILRVNDAVELLNEASESDPLAPPHLALVARMWEDMRQAKKIECRWFYRPTDVPTAMLRTLPNGPALPNELFLSDVHDANRVESIAAIAKLDMVAEDADPKQSMFLSDVHGASRVESIAAIAKLDMVAEDADPKQVCSHVGYVGVHRLYIPLESMFLSDVYNANRVEPLAAIAKLDMVAEDADPKQCPFCGALQLLLQSRRTYVPHALTDAFNKATCESSCAHEAVHKCDDKKRRLISLAARGCIYSEGTKDIRCGSLNSSERKAGFMQPGMSARAERIAPYITTCCHTMPDVCALLLYAASCRALQLPTTEGVPWSQNAQLFHVRYAFTAKLPVFRALTPAERAVLTEQAARRALRLANAASTRRARMRARLSKAQLLATVASAINASDGENAAAVGDDDATVAAIAAAAPARKRAGSSSAQRGDVRARDGGKSPASALVKRKRGAAAAASGERRALAAPGSPDAAPQRPAVRGGSQRVTPADVYSRARASARGSTSDNDNEDDDDEDGGTPPPPRARRRSSAPPPPPPPPQVTLGDVPEAERCALDTLINAAEASTQGGGAFFRCGVPLLAVEVEVGCACVGDVPEAERCALDTLINAAEASTQCGGAFSSARAGAGTSAAEAVEIDDADAANQMPPPYSPPANQKMAFSPAERRTRPLSADARWRANARLFALRSITAPYDSPAAVFTSADAVSHLHCCRVLSAVPAAAWSRPPQRQRQQRPRPLAGKLRAAQAERCHQARRNSKFALSLPTPPCATPQNSWRNSPQWPRGDGAAAAMTRWQQHTLGGSSSGGGGSSGGVKPGAPPESPTFRAAAAEAAAAPRRRGGSGGGAELSGNSAQGRARGQGAGLDALLDSQTLGGGGTSGSSNNRSLQSWPHQYEGAAGG